MADYDDDEFFDSTQATVFVSDDEEDEEEPKGRAFMRGVEEAEQLIEKADDEDELYEE